MRGLFSLPPAFFSFPVDVFPLDVVALPAVIVDFPSFAFFDVSASSTALRILLDLCSREVAVVPRTWAASATAVGPPDASEIGISIFYELIAFILNTDENHDLCKKTRNRAERTLPQKQRLGPKKYIYVFDAEFAQP